jgi:hypothetical protein
MIGADTAPYQAAHRRRDASLERPAAGEKGASTTVSSRKTRLTSMISRSCNSRATGTISISDVLLTAPLDYQKPGIYRRTRRRTRCRASATKVVATRGDAKGQGAASGVGIFQSARPRAVSAGISASVRILRTFSLQLRPRPDHGPVLRSQFGLGARRGQKGWMHPDTLKRYRTEDTVIANVSARVSSVEFRSIYVSSFVMIGSGVRIPLAHHKINGLGRRDVRGAKPVASV